MKGFIKQRVLFALAGFSILFAFQTAAAQASARDKKTAGEFENRVKEYIKLRARLEKQLPKLPKDATPERIETHKRALQKSLLAARQTARQGEFFTLPATRLIREIIKNEFKGEERLEFRRSVLEADIKSVPLKVNVPYPETAEQIEMPPALLLILPQLPEQLRYRFAGRNLLLVDRESELILDYMANALP